MKNAIDKVVEYLLVLMMSLMVLNVTWQVLSRYILSSPSTFTEESARFLMIWLGFIGGSYVAGKQMHPAIDLLATKLSPKSQAKLNRMLHAFVALFALFALVIGGTYLVSFTFALNQTSAALELPIGIVYLCIPVSGVLLIYYSIFNIKHT